MNKDLFCKIKKQILNEPLRFDMNYWVRPPGYGAYHTPEVAQEQESCGTVCCLAGWAITMDGKYKTAHTSFEGLPSQDLEPGFHNREAAEGARLLEIPASHAKMLFYPWNWPKEFRDGFRGQSRKQQAAAAAALIDAYVADPEMTVARGVPLQPHQLGSWDDADEYDERAGS